MKYTLLFLSLLLGIFLRLFVFSPYRVTENTMAPNLIKGDLILASQIGYGIRLPWMSSAYFKQNPKKNDMVLYVKNSKVYLRRVIAIAGDSLEMRNGELTINGKLCNYEGKKNSLSEDYYFVEETCENDKRWITKNINNEANIAFYNEVVPADSIFVMRDFRHADNANPNIDTLFADQIISKPYWIWLSWSTTQDFISNSLGLRWNRILTKLQ